MTKSQDAAAVVLRKKKKKEKNRPNNNQTAQIKFPNTLASRLHSSHFSIIYRCPQSDAAELELAGGSKLGLERRWGHTEHAQGVSAGLGERVPSPPGLVSLAGGRPALLAGNLLSPGVVLPRVGQFDLKGFLPPKPKLGGDGGLFSTQETRLWIIKKASWSCQDQDPDPCVEGRGTLLGFQAAFFSSPLWFCNTGLQKKGTRLPWKCWRAKEGRQRPPYSWS